MSTILFTAAQHATHSHQHPEHAGRIDAIMAAIATDTACAPIYAEVTPVPMNVVNAVHPQSHIDWVQTQSIQARTVPMLDGDTYIQPGTAHAAHLAASAACHAIDAIVGGHTPFALTRPPGHHATATQSMGFCFYNNVAVAARYAQHAHGIRRIAIVDIDVHHGNGTDDIFREDPDVMYVSTHGWPLYPGSGARDSFGSGAGYGTTLNIPMPAQSGDSAFLNVYQNLVIPALERFKPELLLVSAGFDAHWDDPLGNCRLSVTGYLDICTLLQSAATMLCNGRWGAVLEGGYSLRALAACGHGLVRLMQHVPRVPDELGQKPSDPHRADALVSWLQNNHPLLKPA